MLLSEVLNENTKTGKRSTIICSNEGDIDLVLTRIQDILVDRGMSVGACRSERSLFENMSAFENIFLTKQYPRGKKKRQQYEILAELQKRIGSDIPADLPVNKLNVVEKYTVELIRLALQAPEVIIIDYILSFLGYYEYTIFCNLLTVMQEKGSAVIILTNRWEDMLGLCGDFIVFNKTKDYYTSITANEIQKNPRRLLFELLGYDDLETSADLVRTLNAISGIVELFDTGKNLEQELVKLTDIARQELGASSCMAYLKGFENKILAYYNRNPDHSRYKLRDPVVLLLITDTKPDSGMHLYTRNADEAKLLFQDMPEQTEMIVTVPITIIPDQIGIIVFTFNHSFIIEEEQSAVIRMLRRAIEELIVASNMFNNTMMMHESNHRINNNLQMIISLLYMQKDLVGQDTGRTFSIPDVQELLDEIIGRIKVIANVQNIISGKAHSVYLRSITEDIIHNYESLGPDIKFEMDVENVVVRRNKATLLAMILNELVCNSCKHAFPDDSLREEKHIRVTAVYDEKLLTVRVSDNGIGVPENLEIEKVQSTGMRLIGFACRQLQAKIHFETTHGTTAVMSFPEIVDVSYMQGGIS